MLMKTLDLPSLFAKNQFVLENKKNSCFLAPFIYKIKAFS